MDGVTGLIFTTLLSLFSGNGIDTNREWICARPGWESEPTVERGMFRGTLTVQCSFTSRSEGDYRKLALESIDEIKSLASKLHSGPNSVEFMGMPAASLDATLPVNDNGIRTVRSDIHVASNDQDHFVYDAVSTAINATGTAKNLKQLNSRADLKRGKSLGTHELTISATSHVQKPAIISAARFKQMVMQQMEEGVVSQEKRAIEGLIQKL